MVKGFLPENCAVKSFYAPYYCEGCDIEDEKYLTPDQVTDKKAPEFKCGVCGGDDNIMEFDAIESQFFNFIK